MTFQRIFTLAAAAAAACLLLLLLSSASAFTVHAPTSLLSKQQSPTSLSALSTTSTSFFETASSSQVHAAATVDPTAALSNALGSFMGSPAILAIPIVAALGVATLIAFLIYSYAQPAVEDDEY